MKQVVADAAIDDYLLHRRRRAPSPNES
jgi:hypothetical protein